EMVFNTIRAIQYDPQSICGRSIDLSLQARVKDIHPSDYYYWLYIGRKGIEVYDKELSVIPIEDLSLCRKRFPPSRKRKLDNFIHDNYKELEELLKYIDTNGPICAGDILDNRKVDIFWESASWSKVALDSLWKIGKLIIACRKNGHKYYDIPEKYYDSFIWSCGEDLLDSQVMRRLKCVGLLPASGTGPGWMGLGTGKEISLKIKDLIKKGDILKIKSNETSNSYILASDDQKLLQAAICEKPTERKISFLSPLDNLLWDRKMIRDIFNFDYKWEAYTPKSKRMYGHYVLPILYGSNLIGRVEPVHDKEKNILEIKGLWMESFFNWDSESKEAFWGYLEEFRKYLRADEIEFKCYTP
ncbi:MAG: crosslink repair DNA glycosylase YcaQ family protein, partial [Methanotrichaceae archaeon]